MCKTFLPIFGDSFLSHSSRILIIEAVVKNLAGCAARATVDVVLTVCEKEYCNTAQLNLSLHARQLV
jgi:hypothetical protein